VTSNSSSGKKDGVSQWLVVLVSVIGMAFACAIVLDAPYKMVFAAILGGAGLLATVILTVSRFVSCCRLATSLGQAGVLRTLKYTAVMAFGGTLLVAVDVTNNVVRRESENWRLMIYIFALLAASNLLQVSESLLRTLAAGGQSEQP
jgi:hypothetical protein